VGVLEDGEEEYDGGGDDGVTGHADVTLVQGVTDRD